MSKVVFFIQAYNAEGTLRRAVESILNQTCGEIVLYLCDDASTDGTREIMREYARIDSRIRTIFHDVNHRAPGGSGLFPVFPFVATTFIDDYNNGNADYFCLLDADDEYKPDFLEKMLVFAKENDLDIAACGYEDVRIQTGETFYVRKLPTNMFIEGDAFNLQFPTYFQFFRGMVAKLYRVSTLRLCEYKNYKNLEAASHGADALFNLRALLHARRLGVLAESLYLRYVTPDSVSQRYDSKRIVSDRIVFNDSVDFLTKKTGAVSTANKEFLFGVYMLAIMDSLSVLIQSKTDIEEKFAGINDIFTYPLTRELFALDFSATQMLSSEAMIDTRDRFVRDICSWIMSNKEARSGKGMDITAQALCTMGMLPSKYGGWSDAEMSKLQSKIRKRAGLR